MPGTVRPVADEREGLLAYLAQQRYVLRLTTHGLTEQQVRATPTPSTLSVGGLVKHVSYVERYWVDGIVLGQPGAGSGEAYMAGFTLGPDETMAGVLAAYDEVAAHTEEVVAGMDLGDPVPVPRDAPWFPKDVDAWSVRWVLLHLITETARHAGHADLVRESIDGATAFPLMAAAEGWPATPWLRPWEPPGS